MSPTRWIVAIVASSIIGVGVAAAVHAAHGSAGAATTTRAKTAQIPAVRLVSSSVRQHDVRAKARCVSRVSSDLTTVSRTCVKVTVHPGSTHP